VQSEVDAGLHLRGRTIGGERIHDLVPDAGINQQTRMTALEPG
jgi:hypothetical protein